MGQKLQHGIGGGVQNGPTGSHVLSAQSVHDLSAAGDLVAQHGHPRHPLHKPHHLRRESLRIGTERMLGDQTAQLPVAGDGILSGGDLLQTGDTGEGVLHRLHTGHVSQSSEPQPLEVGQLQPPHFPRQIAQSVAARIPVHKGVGS